MNPALCKYSGCNGVPNLAEAAHGNQGGCQVFEDIVDVSNYRLVDSYATQLIIPSNDAFEVAKTLFEPQCLTQQLTFLAVARPRSKRREHIAVVVTK
jgi:hypothetical protein